MENESERRRRAGGRSRRPPRSPQRVSAEIAAVSLALGALMGVAWYGLTPEIIGQTTENGIAVPVEQARQLFDRVAVFSLLSAGIGLVVGSVMGARHRRRPVTALVALAVGGLGGSLLALGVGILLGPSAHDAEPGTDVAVPMELEAPAALFVWPLVAVIVVTIMAVFRDDRAPWSWNGRGS